MTKEQLRKGLILAVVVLAVVAVWYFKNSTPADSPSSEVIRKPEGTLNEGSLASQIDRDLNNSEGTLNEGSPASQIDQDLNNSESQSNEGSLASQIDQDLNNSESQANEGSPASQIDQDLNNSESQSNEGSPASLIDQDLNNSESQSNEGSPASLIDQDLNNSESQSNEDAEDEKVLPEYNFEVTDFNLEELKSYNVPILLQFGASWCPPCQAMKPYLADLYDQYKDQMFILYLDVDLLENGTHGHPVQVLPTQFFYNADGTPLIPCDSFQNIERLVDRNTGEHVLTRNQGYLDLDSLVHLLRDMGVE